MSLGALNQRIMIAAFKVFSNPQLREEVKGEQGAQALEQMSLHLKFTKLKALRCDVLQNKEDSPWLGRHLVLSGLVWSLLPMTVVTLAFSGMAKRG